MDLKKGNGHLTCHMGFISHVHVKKSPEETGRTFCLSLPKVANQILSLPVETVGRITVFTKSLKCLPFVCDYVTGRLNRG